MESTKIDIESFAAWIGIDWADEEHAICLFAKGSDRVERSKVKQTPEDLQEWISELRIRFAGSKIAIAVEQTRGPLIYGLIGCEFMVLYPINPKSLARYREALCGSGAKDDPTDAELLLQFLRSHQDRLKAWFPEDPQTRKLRMLVEFRRKLVNRTTAIRNQITGLLKGYYPQALDSVAQVRTKMACDFLSRWPSLGQLQKARPAQLRKFYYQHNCRYVQLVDQRIAEIRTARALTEDEAIVSSSALMIEALVEELRPLLSQIDRFDKEIAKAFQAHPDREIFQSFPGAGPALAPRLAVALGTDRDRFESALEIQQFYGTAPVTERSGKHTWIHWRWACPKFGRQSFVEFAGESILFSRWASAFYKEQMRQKKTRHAAIRSLAYRWQRIIFRCWKNGTLYDEEKYLKALQRRNSPLVKLLNLPKTPKSAMQNRSGWSSAGDIITKLRQSTVEGNVQKTK
ncbi:IS110 family transposase [bacterium]|nr:IS110 family transposase [bacterium]